MDNDRNMSKTTGKVRLITGLADFFQKLVITAISLLFASMIGAAIMMPLGRQGWIIILSLVMFSACYLILSHYFEESLTTFFEKIFGNLPSVPEVNQKHDE
jgi:hypothetical protein